MNDASCTKQGSNSEANGRVVIELSQDQVEIIGTSLPAENCEPISREEQAKNLDEFLKQLSSDLNIKKVILSHGRF